MARDLSAQTRVDNTDPDYVNGKLVDSTESVEGTLIGEGINQDIVQFFQKLMDLASLVANGDPDNEANGYQFIAALIDKIQEEAPGAPEFGGVSFQKLDIGVWDMDANQSRSVAISIPPGKHITGIIATILPDDWASTYRAYNLEGHLSTPGSPSGSILGYNVVSSNINLIRVAGDFFDSSNFSTTDRTRGYVTVFFADDPA
jgi:hypothetical protein